MHDEATLIRRSKDGDREALAELLRAYQDRIFSYLLGMLKNHHDAEEVVQETFVRAINGLKKYREQGHFKAWLYRIAYNEGLRRIRKREIPVEQESQPEIADESGAPDEALLTRERIGEIHDAIHQLPEKERQVVLLRAYSGLSFQQIADIMDSPLGTALGRMRNAKTRLRDALA